jgi:glycosyltransferase involved in cell wall biosynthesis
MQRTFAEHKDFAITDREIDHADNCFGLCLARNHGLDVASVNTVAYLDDDNTLYPAFVSEMLQFLSERPTVRMTMARQ